MKHPIKRKFFILTEEDELYNNALKVISDSLFKKLEQDLVNEKDPFEKYMKEVHLRLFNEVQDYPERIVKGRSIIFQILENERKN